MKRFIQKNIFLYFFLLVLGISGFFFAVVWPQVEGFYVFIALVAAGGFGASFYIFYAKKYHGGLVCPVGSNCNAVVTSRYAVFFGVRLEYWGMLYYLFILISYIFLIFFSHPLLEFFSFGVAMLSAGAFLFSLYLLGVQGFILREWCIWCILSAVFSTLIFIISFSSIGLVTSFLVEISAVIALLHMLGFVIGLGGTTVAFFLFYRFLGDFDIDEKELRILKWVLEFMWFGLAVVLASQFVFYIAHAELLALSGVFIVQTVALFIVAISGAVLMIIFAPFLAVIPFDRASRDHPSLASLRRPIFILGAVVLSSWYFAFVMNYLQGYGFVVLFAFYIVVLVVSVVLALFWEKRFES